MFKHQSPSKCPLFDAIHLSRCFCTAQNSFWTPRFWCLLVLLPFFVSPLQHLQNVSFENFFHPGKETKKGFSGQDLVNREGGWCRCWSKTAEHSVRCGQVHSKNGQTLWKSLQTNSQKWNTASHNNASWCTVIGGFLEHSPREESLYYKGSTLQKIIPVFTGAPLINAFNSELRR